ncbi:MAG TPA: hypothetical protein VK970_01080, partial [Candidatus Methylacidiphilales bacterium]|nr:hypothetical protein [Candidatus Methylacidiphilales bacterium]
SPHELGALRLMQQLGMPPALVKFYSQLNPAGTIEIGRVQMHAVSEMKERNTSAFPGIHLFKAGYIVFASTVNGDLYCFDTTQDKEGADLMHISIQLFSHEPEADLKGMNAAQLSEFGTTVAHHLEEFLAKMLRGTLQTDPDPDMLDDDE